MKKFKSMSFLILLVAAASAGVVLSPRTVDAVSEDLLQTSDMISVILLYDTPVD